MYLTHKSFTAFLHYRNGLFENVIIYTRWIFPKSFLPFPLKVERGYSHHSKRFSIKTTLFLRSFPNLSANSPCPPSRRIMRKFLIEEGKKYQFRKLSQDVDPQKMFQIADLYLAHSLSERFPNNRFQASKLPIYRT